MEDNEKKYIENLVTNTLEDTAQRIFEEETEKEKKKRLDPLYELYEKLKYVENLEEISIEVHEPCFGCVSVNFDSRWDDDNNFLNIRKDNPNNLGGYSVYCYDYDDGNHVAHCFFFEQIIVLIINFIATWDFDRAVKIAECELVVEKRASKIL